MRRSGISLFCVFVALSCGSKKQDTPNLRSGELNQGAKSSPAAEELGVEAKSFVTGVADLSDAEVNLVGWTADSRYFVYAENMEAVDERGNLTQTATRVSVCDTWNEANTLVFPISWTQLRKGDSNWYLRNGPPLKEALAAWLKDHPLVTSKPARDHVGGGSADVRVGAPNRGSWKGDTFHVEFAPQSIAVSFLNTRGTWHQESQSWLIPSSGVAKTWTVAPHWSPNGSRIAWVIELHREQESTRSLIGYEVIQNAGPIVHVIAPPGIGAALPHVVARVEKLGLAVSQPGISYSDTPTKPATTILVGKYANKEAENLAAALPGTATMTPLAQPALGNTIQGKPTPRFDVVVVVGEELARATTTDPDVTLGREPAITAQGWTKDSAYFVCFQREERVVDGPRMSLVPFGQGRTEISGLQTLSKEQQEHIEVVPTPGDHPTEVVEIVRIANVYDARAGGVHKYLLEWTPRARGEYVLKLKYSKLPGRVEYESWQAKHPLVPPGAVRGSPPGSVSILEPEATDKEGIEPGSLEVTDQREFRYREGSEAEPLRLVAERDRFKTETIFYTGGTGNMGTRIKTITPCWAPNGTRLAWVLNSTGLLRGNAGPQPGYGEVRVVAVGPRIQILAPDKIRKVLPLVVTAVERAGFAVSLTGRANKHRARTVVYAADGLEIIAKAVANVVPGGADIVPLSWKADADVVVGLGDSASR